MCRAYYRITIFNKVCVRTNFPVNWHKMPSHKENKPITDSIQQHHEKMVDRYLDGCVVSELNIMKRMLISSNDNDNSEGARHIRKHGSRPTLALMAHILLKKQARVKRTKNLLTIAQSVNNEPGLLQSSYMDQSDTQKFTALYNLPLQFWARPKTLHICTHCSVVSHADCWYMPVRDGCKIARFCSKSCLKSSWKLGHKPHCRADSPVAYEINLFYSMAPTLFEYYRLPESHRAKTPFWEVSCADVYGEKLQFRPLKLTRDVKAMFEGFIPREGFHAVLTQPYKILCLMIWSESNNRPFYQPMVIRADMRTKNLTGLTRRNKQDYKDLWQ